MTDYKLPSRPRSPGLAPSPRIEEPQYPSTSSVVEVTRLCLRIKELEAENADLRSRLDSIRHLTAEPPNKETSP